jgi:hypothetical protein
MSDNVPQAGLTNSKFLDSLAILPGKNCHGMWGAGMARGPNRVTSLEITFTVNSQTGWYLDRMVEMGVFGNTRNEAARIALYDHCKLLVAQEKMKMAPPIEGSDATSVTVG